MASVLHGRYQNRTEMESKQTEVEPRAMRRTFTAAYKRQILEEVDRCGRGEIGALLRREGLYDSLIDKWRRARERGVLEALNPQKRGPRTEGDSAVVAQLRRENERLTRRLEDAEAILDVQKKLFALYGVTPSRENW